MHAPAFRLEHDNSIRGSGALDHRTHANEFTNSGPCPSSTAEHHHMYNGSAAGIPGPIPSLSQPQAAQVPGHSLFNSSQFLSSVLAAAAAADHSSSPSPQWSTVNVNSMHASSAASPPPRMVSSGSKRKSSSGEQSDGGDSSGGDYEPSGQRARGGPGAAGDEEDSAEGPETLRRGRWTFEEERYASCLVSHFEQGWLDLPVGTSLRTFLAEQLRCDPMRITKKFAGDSSVGKRIYHPALAAVAANSSTARASMQAAAAELEALARDFFGRVALEKRRPGPRGRSAAAAASVAPPTTLAASTGGSSRSGRPSDNKRDTPGFAPPAPAPATASSSSSSSASRRHAPGSRRARAPSMSGRSDHGYGSGSNAAIEEGDEYDNNSHYHHEVVREEGRNHYNNNNTDMANDSGSPETSYPHQSHTELDAALLLNFVHGAAAASAAARTSDGSCGSPRSHGSGGGSSAFGGGGCSSDDRGDDDTSSGEDNGGSASFNGGGGRKLPRREASPPAALPARVGSILSSEDDSAAPSSVVDQQQQLQRRSGTRAATVKATLDGSVSGDGADEAPKRGAPQRTRENTCMSLIG